MAKTVLNIKTDVDVKRDAQVLAKKIGVPLSTIVNAQLKSFIAERGITLSEALEPSPYLKKVIEESEKAGPEEYSPRFTSADDAMHWLEDDAA